MKEFFVALILCGDTCNVDDTINPLPPSVPYMVRLAKFSISIYEGIIKKIFYDRRDYESVDEKSLRQNHVPKNDEKRIQAVKGKWSS